MSDGHATAVAEAATPIQAMPPSLAAPPSPLSAPCSVLMLPDYRGENPYQELLAAAVETNGFRVSFPKGYRRVLPIYRAVCDRPSTRVLHLHWTGPYVQGSNRLAFMAYLAKFIADLALVRLSGRRIVWTMHNLIPHEAKFPRLESFTRRIICRLASRVIVHGHAGEREAERRFGCPPQRICVIPHGHYRDVYGEVPPRNVARSRLGIDPGVRLYLFLGFLRPYKGIELLLRAWRRFNPANGLLLIVGKANDGDYAAELGRMASECPNVQLRDRFVEEHEIPNYFGAADVAVLPFERVQTSGSLALAMSYGRPIVTSKLGELPETLAGADDLTFEAGKEDDLLQQLRRTESIDLQDLSRRTEAACNRLSWDAIGAATAEAYRGAMSRGMAANRSDSRLDPNCRSAAL